MQACTQLISSCLAISDPYGFMYLCSCAALSQELTQTRIRPPPSAVFMFCIQMHNKSETFIHILIMYFIKCTHAQTQADAQTPHIHLEKLLCGIQNRCSWLESLSTASDVTSARSVSCSSPTPFLFPTLFHQLNPSFDTSEGVPHMPVTSPLLHRRFLHSSLSRARVSVWNLCTL